MKTIALMVMLMWVAACGGSAGQSLNPAGTWSVTDTLNVPLSTGACAAVAPTTLTVIGGPALKDYATSAAYCQQAFCELQGTAGSTFRDLGFHGDNTLSGTRTDGTQAACARLNGTATGPCCVYETTGTRQ